MNLTQDSSCICEIHNKPMIKAHFGTFCDECTKEQINKENEALTRDFSKKRNQEERDRYKLFFENESMIADQRITLCTFDNYKPATKEAFENHQKAKECCELYSEGKVFNLFFAGVCGAGKSHLAYSIVKELSNHKKVLFVTMGELLRKVKSTFQKDSTLSEYDIIKKLTKVDVLVIDDLGAETGSIDSDKRATDFINRVLFDVLDGRQGKSTIFTTNLTSKQIEQKYDERSYSRMVNNFDFIKFEETTDYRKKKVRF